MPPAFSAPAGAALSSAQFQQLLATHAVAAWMLGRGAAFQQAGCLDATAWLAFALFCGAPVPVDPLEFEDLETWAQAGAIRGLALDCGAWCVVEDDAGLAKLMPERLLPAGHALLAGHGAPVAAIQDRLDWLAGFLPWADRERSEQWAGLCLTWLADELSWGRRLGPAALVGADGSLLSGVVCGGGADVGRYQAIVANLARLRELAAVQFGPAGA